MHNSNSSRAQTWTWLWPILRALLPRGIRPAARLRHLVQRRTEFRVQNGPFAGMKYGRQAIASAYIPKLLGIYERELTQPLEQACARRSSTVINIGAAEGYYAAGLALRIPNAEIIAFETSEAGRSALRELCALNAVDHRVVIQGHCDPPDLASALARASSALIVCDVEGAELQLLDRRAIPALDRAAILVEAHDFIVPGTTSTLVERFRTTHEIRQIWQESRNQSDFPFRNWYTKLVPRRFIEWAVSEWRPWRMSWLWMVPKELSHASPDAERGRPRPPTSFAVPSPKGRGQG